MKSGFEVLRAGIQSTVQDLGRSDAAHWGVPQAGAADRLALVLANLLLGNSPEAACIEITMGGFQIRFLSPTDFALAGADCVASLDDQLILPYARSHAQAGQILTLKPPAKGLRTYLALWGGVDVPLVLASRSTLLTAQFGGMAGRALRVGDVLYAIQSGVSLLSPRSIAPPTWRSVIRVMLGPQWNHLTPVAQQFFLKTHWQLSHQSDRMGLKLSGNKLQMAIPIEMASQAVFSGTIQLPPNGQPILLLADAQTTGGYPIIAQVIQADLWLAGQCRANDRIQFEIVDDYAAVLALRAQRDWLSKLKRIVCSSI